VPFAAGERNPGELLLRLQILDRNSNVRFYKQMAAKRLQKSPVHDLMHSQLFNHSACVFTYGKLVVTR
jgi:hypothetical protein